jgi:hypothetical protein
MRLLPILLVVVLCSTSFAGMRRAPVPHALTSPGGHYVFTMVPGPKDQEYSKGSGVCSKIESDGTLTEIWRTSGFYSEDLELHYDGNALARIGSWESGDQEEGDPKESLAVAFYVKGKEVKRYKVSDLVKDESKLPVTSAGLSWLEYKLYQSPAFRPGEEIFHLETVDGIHYRFDMNTGAIL